MRRLLSTVLALGLVLVAITPASAADEIGLSRDGSRWADTLEDPLFDPGMSWVPGDSKTVSFYVRNQADTDAVLSAAVLTADGDRLLEDDHVTLRARAGGRWFPLENGSISSGLTDASISPGDQVRVDLEAAFDPASTNVSQAAKLDLLLRVRLADANASPTPMPTPTPTPTDKPTTPVPDVPHESGTDPDESRAGDRSADHLPSTGSSTPVILIWMAVLAMTASAAFLAAGRRERENEDV